MQVYEHWTPDQPVTSAARAVALGAFDGWHIGHRAVVSALCGQTEIASPAAPLLCTAVLSLIGVPKGEPTRLTVPSREAELLQTLGLDEWFTLPFEAVQDLSPEAFVEQILEQALGAKLVCCGYNYHFGKEGVGDADTLKDLCEARGIRVITVPPVERDGESVSSTRIRTALAAGELPTVTALLGRPFEVELPVSEGAHLGRTWGFPTLNQVFPPSLTVPRFGVYASLVTVEDRAYFAVTNIGVHPTVGGTSVPQAETWMADFDGDLYGQTVRVRLIRFLREECIFPSVDDLREQIQRDRETAVALLSGEETARAVLFDFDDTLQNRTTAFLAMAEELLRRHCPLLTEEEYHARAERMHRLNHGGYVDYAKYFTMLYEAWEWQGLSSPEELKAEFHRGLAVHSALFADTVPVLKALKERGYRIGIVTNGSAVLQNLKLDCSGLRPLLDIAVVSGDEGVHKPNPELFRRAAAMLCTAPQHCTYVGDHPVNDVEGSEAAGMNPIYLNTRADRAAEEDIPELHTLPELLTLL